MGVASFFVFVAFNPTQSLTTLEDNVNGAVSLAVLYLTFMITSLLFAVPIVQRFGPKVGLIGASWTYMIFVAARSLPSDWKAPRLAAMYCTAFGVGAGGAVLWTSIGTYLSTLGSDDPFLTKSCSDNFYGIFFVNGIIAYSVVLACTRLQLPTDRMYLFLCLVCAFGCLLYFMLPKYVVVLKPRKTLREKLLLTSRHMQRRSVLALLPVWAYHHFVLAYSSGVLPQLASDQFSRAVVLFALGIGICGGSFGSFCIAPTVSRCRVLTILLLLGSIGISISGSSACSSGMCPQLCVAAACMGVSWGCLPGIATQTLNALHPNSKEENFASYIFMGSLTQVFVYLGMSAAPLGGIAVSGVALAVLALVCMLYCEFRVESLNGNTEFSSGSTVHQEIEASDADSVPMLNTSETL